MRTVLPCHDYGVEDWYLFGTGLATGPHDRQYDKSVSARFMIWDFYEKIPWASGKRNPATGQSLYCLGKAIMAFWQHADVFSVFHCLSLSIKVGNAHLSCVTVSQNIYHKVIIKVTSVGDFAMHSVLDLQLPQSPYTRHIRVGGSRFASIPRIEFDL